MLRISTIDLHGLYNKVKQFWCDVWRTSGKQESLVMAGVMITLGLATVLTSVVTIA
jgi:hypothetical protein